MQYEGQNFFVVALDIGRQITEALEAAHEKGIIHRDLKPANIKITPQGRVKVLDFGLAKIYERADVVQDLSNSPTLSSLDTAGGVILGTAAYMAPEQAKGKPVDHRADICAFGVVLYKTLTGGQLFQGETTTETLAAVLEREPDWSRLPKVTPAEIQHLLRRCLQKDRNRRLQTVADARIEIEESRAKLERAEPAVASAAPRGRERLVWKLIAGVLFIAVVALAIPSIVRLREASRADAPEMRVDIIMPATSDPVSFAISPDGWRLVFVADSDAQSGLWLRPLDAVTAQPLAGTEGATLPFWSPDSRSVGFFAGNRLKRVDIGGGLPQTLTSVGNNPGGGTWSPQGVILFAGGGGGLFRIPASGGETVAVTKLDSPRRFSHRRPQFLANGRQFVQRGRRRGISLGVASKQDRQRLVA